MPTSRLVVIAIMLVAGCGDDWHASPDGYHGGSRLRAKFLVGDSGARQFQGFFDSELDVDCYFVGDPPRCIPTPIADTWAFYSDSECTTRIAVRSTDPCSVPPRYAGVDETADCFYAPTRLWKIGEPLPSSTTTYVVSTTGVCSEAALPSETAAFELGDEIAIDRLVEGHHELVGDGRLRTDFLVGDDGSRQPWNTFDSQLDASCYMYPPMQRCVPDGAYASRYVDDACSVPVGQTGGCQPEPTVVQEWQLGGVCDYEVHVYEAGSAVEPPQLWYVQSQACAPIAVDDFTYWSVGAEVTPDAMAFLQPTTIGDGRLRMKFYAGDNDYLMRSSDFHDSQLDVDCSASQVDDDEWRCIPSSEAYTVPVFYADLDCTQPILVMETYASCGSTSPPDADWAIGSTEEGSCQYSRHRYAPGAELASGAIYEQDQTGTCAPATWDTAEIRRWRTGDELGFADYALLRETTD